MRLVVGLMSVLIIALVGFIFLKSDGSEKEERTSTPAKVTQSTAASQVVQPPAAAPPAAAPPVAAPPVAAPPVAAPPSPVAALNWTVQADPNNPKKALVPPALRPVNGVIPGSNISIGNECSSGVECSKMCFRGRCVPRKQIVCPAYAQCPPTYWRMYWYLEKLCHNMFAPKHWKYLYDGRYKNESTARDLVYLWNLPGAATRYRFKRARYMNSFFYHPRRAEWLPAPCLQVVGKMASKRDVSSSTRGYAKKIRKLWKETKHW